MYHLAMIHFTFLKNFMMETSTLDVYVAFNYNKALKSYPDNIVSLTNYS